MTYASPLRRLLAFSLDCLVLITFYVLMGITALFKPALALPMLGLWFYGGLFALAWLYYALCESSRFQATLGKKVLGLKVVNLKGEKVNFLQASGRYFGKLLSRMTLMFGFVMVAFTKKRQALHDKIAKTLVIHASSES